MRAHGLARIKSGLRPERETVNGVCRQGDIPAVAVKIQARRDNGAKFELLVPAIVDSDGIITVDMIQALAAAKIMRAEAYPEQ